MAVPAADCRVVIGGVDTHKDVHVAAVIDLHGIALGTEQFSTTRAGYRHLLARMRRFGELRCVGIEGTGSYGAGSVDRSSIGGFSTTCTDTILL